MCDDEFMAGFVSGLLVPVVLALCAKIVDAETREIKSSNAELRRSLEDISNAKKIAELEEENERLRGKTGDMELALLKAQVEKEGR